jgi:hypothetical protein
MSSIIDLMLNTASSWSSSWVIPAIPSRGEQEREAQPRWRVERQARAAVTHQRLSQSRLAPRLRPARISQRRHKGHVRPSHETRLRYLITHLDVNREGTAVSLQK